MIAGKRFSLVFILAACWVPTAFGDPSIDGLSRSRWAERLPGGPMKVVFLAPYGAQQDSFELMQRFDIDGTVVMMAAYDTQGYLNGLRNVGHYWPELWPMAEDAHAALGELVAAGDGDWHDVPSGQKGGHPSRVFQLSTLSTLLKHNLITIGGNCERCQPDSRSRPIGNSVRGSW